MVNWYLVIPFSDTVPNPFIADSSDLKGFSEWDFMKGGTIENWNKEAWLKAEKKFQAKIDKMDYDLETMRRVKERLTSGE